MGTSNSRPLVLLSRRRRGDQRRPAAVAVTRKDKQYCVVSFGLLGLVLASGWTADSWSSHQHHGLRCHCYGVKRGQLGVITCVWCRGVVGT